MTTKMKNIAVLMTAIDADGQAQILEGIEKCGKENGCNIAVFVWFTGAYEKDKHNLGELNIAKLPDLNLFDGVIVVANALHMETNRKIILELLTNLTCPVVTIGAKIDGYYYVGTDTYSTMRKIVEHFVVHHNKKRIHFVKGIEGNPDGDARFQAYLDVLKEHNIPIEKERISQGDFYIIGGELAANQILNSDLPFPEVVVCANDIMAITVSNMLMKKGYRVPEDVMISGYDYTLEGQQHVPSLTTVRSNFDLLGIEACKIILEVNKGNEISADTLLEDEVIYGNSCGCRKADVEETGIILRSMKTKDAFQRKLIHQLIEVEKNIMEGDEYEDWLDALKKFVVKTEPKEFYCCVNENFMEKVFKMGVRQQEAMSLQERLAYDENISVTLAYKDGKFIEKSDFPSKYAFDELFEQREEGKIYIFSPIHYLERNFGYFVFVDSSFPVNNPLYVNWLINMGDAIENIRKQNLLQIAIRELNEMYIRDSLTGVYNRFGLERFFKELKERCMREEKKMMISFVDVDRLKYINDRYGHDRGDQIIRMAAGVLSMSAKDYCIVRYGGDEFVVLGVMEDEAEAVVYWERVMKAVENYNALTTLEDTDAGLSISYGYELFDANEKLSQAECIRIVDNKMYVDKNRKKKQRTEYIREK